jgi:hypothetical protein
MPLIFVAVLTPVLLWPALHNGYPLTFWDSAGYTTTAVDWVTYGRPFPYSAFLNIAGLGRSGWLVVVAQALLTAAALWVTLRVALPPERRGRFLAPGLVALGTGLSYLPFYTSYLMPDIFGLLGVLAFYLLLVAERRWLQVASFLLLALSASVHNANVPMLGALAVCCLLFSGKWRFASAMAAVLAGVVLVGAMHKAKMGEFFYSKVGQTFVFARLYEDDLIRPAARRVCATRDIPFCPYVEELGGEGKICDDYIWRETSPRLKVKGNVARWERSLIWHSLKWYPLENLAAILRHTGHGLLQTTRMFWLSQDTNFRETLEKLWPRDVPGYDRSGQINGRLLEPQWPKYATWAALAVLVAALGVARPARSSALAKLLFVIALAVVINAAVNGSLSSSDPPRYFARLNGLLFLAAALSVAHAVGVRRRSGTPAQAAR